MQIKCSYSLEKLIDKLSQIITPYLEKQERKLLKLMKLQLKPLIINLSLEGQKTNREMKMKRIFKIRAHHTRHMIGIRRSS